MEIIYETLNAEFTPEALAQMREKRLFSKVLRSMR